MISDLHRDYVPSLVPYQPPVSKPQTLQTLTQTSHWGMKSRADTQIRAAALSAELWAKPLPGIGFKVYNRLKLMELA